MNLAKAEETSAELLDIVERLVRIKTRFNARSTSCGSCGLKHYENLGEAKAVQQIDGAVGRLNKVVELLAGGLDEEDGDAAA